MYDNFLASELEVLYLIDNTIMANMFVQFLRRRGFALAVILIIASALIAFAQLLGLALDGQLTFLNAMTEHATLVMCPAPVQCTAAAHHTPAVHHKPQIEEPKHPHDHRPVTSTAPEACSSTLFPKTFKEIDSLQEPEDASPDATPIDWEEELLTPNGGFLMVENPGHAEPIGYGVSMFHQLHCLTMIRKMLLNQPMSADMEAQGEAWLKDPKHWTHCLDYLVQAIICHADDTLEKPKPTKNFAGDVIDGINGMGHVHQCRNATPLWETVLASESRPVKQSTLGQLTVF